MLLQQTMNSRSIQLKRIAKPIKVLKQEEYNTNIPIYQYTNIPIYQYTNIYQYIKLLLCIPLFPIGRPIHSHLGDIDISELSGMDSIEFLYSKIVFYCSPHLYLAIYHPSPPPSSSLSASPRELELIGLDSNITLESFILTKERLLIQTMDEGKWIVYDFSGVSHTV